MMENDRRQRLIKNMALFIVGMIMFSLGVAWHLVPPVKKQPVPAQP